jgi:pimeloyl-ACP methyl ester carboxylesterase
MPTAHLGGWRCHYLDQGDGPPLVLLHGLGSSARDWAYQFRVYSRTFRVIAPDLRGFGASERKGPFRIEQFATDVWALLDHLRIDRFRLLGYSMGGAVALQMAVAQPWRIERLLITNSVPSFRPTTPGHWYMIGYRLFLMAVLGPKVLGSRTAAQLFPKPEHAALRRINAIRAGRNSRWTYLRALWGLTRWSVVDELSRLTMPSMVIGADHDYFSREEIVKFAYALPKGRLQILRDSHHGLPQECATDFNKLSLKFLLRGLMSPQPQLSEAEPAGSLRAALPR